MFPARKVPYRFTAAPLLNLLPPVGTIDQPRAAAMGWAAAGVGRLAARAAAQLCTSARIHPEARCEIFTGAGKVPAFDSR
jgi:hypothetical protein